MTRITRVEIIDGEGRSYVNWNEDNDIVTSIQDDGKTLKVFVGKTPPEQPITEEENERYFEEAKQIVEKHFAKKKMTEKERIEGEIKLLQKKLDLLEEIEKQPKTLFDVIRNLGYSIDACYEIVDAIEEFEKSKEFQPTPQTNEEVEQGLKDAMRTAKEEGVFNEQENDKNFKSSLDLIREWGEKNKPLNLKELVWEWWVDIFTRNSDLDADASIDILVDMIDKKFIPPSHDTNGYEWEKCLKMMRDKLR
jgi:Zn-dependent metalloprotease